MVNLDTITAVYAKIPNRPGALQHLARTLGERGLNVDAISTETQGDVGIVRFTTHRPKDAVDLLRRAGVEAYESQLLLVYLPNKPNQLAIVAAELAAAGINVEGLLTTPDGHLAVRTSQNDQAAQILRKL